MVRPEAPPGRHGSPEAFPPSGVNLEIVERDLITKALQETQNNRSQAARLLGITRSQLYSRMQKHGFEVGSPRPAATLDSGRPTRR